MVCIVKSYGFSSSYIWLWGLDHKKGWMPKKWCFWTVMPEKTLERPMDSKEIKSVNFKGNQPWIFIGMTDAEAEAAILWHLMGRGNSLEKTLMLRKTEGRRRRGWQRMRWIASLTQWAQVWANSRRWWRTGKPGMLLSMGLQRIWHDLVTEKQGYSQKWTEIRSDIAIYTSSNKVSFE